MIEIKQLDSEHPENVLRALTLEILTRFILRLLFVTITQKRNTEQLNQNKETRSLSAI